MMVSYSVNQKSDTAESTANKLVYGIIAPNPGSADNGKYLKVNGSKIAFTDLPDGITVDSAMSATSTNPVQNKVITEALDGKASTAVATTSANGLMSSADKTKLDGVAVGANKTIVDAALSSTSTNPVQNKAVKAALDGKASTAVATTSTSGLMSAADKTKLGGVADGATRVIVDNAMSATSTNPVQNKVVKKYIDDSVAGGWQFCQRCSVHCTDAHRCAEETGSQEYRGGG